MLLSFDTLKEQPRLFQSLTGLTPLEFVVLLMDFSFAWDIYEVEQLLDSLPHRRRQPGGGRKVTVLPHVEDKLLFLLVYLKCYPLQTVQGVLWGMSQSRVNEWLHTLSPLLKSALQMGNHLPERVASHLAEALDDLDTRIAVIDGTERRRQRPQDADLQKADYSGKKKCHTKKNILITTPERKVNYLSQTYEGKKHDKAIADQEQLTFPEEIVLAQDTGFQGYAPDGVIICQPKKKPKGGELTADEKARNTLISRLRIVVEHVIGGVKRCHSVKDLFRNTRTNFDDLVMELACGLHNFRVDCRSA